MRYVAIAAAVLAVVLLVSAVLAYNGLVRRRNQVDNAWAQVDVQLRRRHDLVPNLVATVQGYAAHERATLEAVARARAAALGSGGAGSPGAGGVVAVATAEQALGGALRGLFAVAEAYPALKADGTFGRLQEELAHTEDRAAYARQYFNDAVLAYNNAAAVFPRNLVAGLGGFRPREYFRVEGPESGPVTVRF